MMDSVQNNSMFIVHAIIRNIYAQVSTTHILLILNIYIYIC
jgi:hypothetical protein